MSRGKLQLCNPFFRGFVPGIAIGVFTSVLLFSLWRYPLKDERPPEAAATSLKIEEPRWKLRDKAAAVNQGPPLSPDTRRSMTKTKPNKLAKNISVVAAASAAAVPGTYALLILIHSSAVQRALRDAVRETWLLQPSQRNSYVARFVVGTQALNEDELASVIEEREEHEDMLLLPEVEEEANSEWPNSRKLLQSFSWAVSHVNFTTLFKCNAATFARLDRILQELQPKRSSVWGYFAGGVKAVRNPESSALAEEDWTLCSHYLPFPEGGGYTISRDLVELVVDMGPDLKHYRHDDIALGVWLSPFKSIRKQHNVWFNPGYYSRGCKNGYLVTHGETADSMRSKYRTLQSKGVLCESEFQSRLSYRYNWTAAASRCCVRKVGIP